MKIRHILLALLVLLAIAFMQPLITFLGGLTLLVGAGMLIFRDLSPAVQDAVERRMLGWLHQARAGSWPESKAPTVATERFPTTSGGVPGIPERTRRVRVKFTAPATPGSTSNNSAPPTG